ncbi:unnamed protein product [Hymenolepis diminuta]|uniref:Uncharacterized protein n=1 Tax=Hymenolepis diminuta TaxID=6216 RepID=A0A564ZER3_HYMDI|nr:unnamed protein product [Hymenolepis diminuta]
MQATLKVMLWLRLTLPTRMNVSESVSGGQIIELTMTIYIAVNSPYSFVAPLCFGL